MFFLIIAKQGTMITFICSSPKVGYIPAIAVRTEAGIPDFSYFIGS